MSQFLKRNQIISPSNQCDCAAPVHIKPQNHCFSPENNQIAIKLRIIDRPASPTKQKQLQLRDTCSTQTKSPPDPTPRNSHLDSVCRSLTFTNSIMTYTIRGNCSGFKRWTDLRFFQPSASSIYDGVRISSGNNCKNDKSVVLLFNRGIYDLLRFRLQLESESLKNEALHILTFTIRLFPCRIEKDQIFHARFLILRRYWSCLQCRVRNTTWLQLDAICRTHNFPWELHQQVVRHPSHSHAIWNGNKNR